MTGREAFEAWSRDEWLWSAWVKPPMFIDAMESGAELKEIEHELYYMQGCGRDTAIIVDLAGESSVAEGLALAKCGWQPVPIFNGTNPPPKTLAVVDNSALQNALLIGAGLLCQAELASDAPPAFLLDSNRELQRYDATPIFDNGWDVYPQDLPTPELLLQRGIKRVLVRSSRLRPDLYDVLRGFYKKAIAIQITDGYTTQLCKLKIRAKK